MKSEKGENLIFIISQPRAGSTLLQKILGNHPKVHTTSEPWLMLHPLYALRDRGYQAEYDAPVSREALKEFLASFPKGEEEYLASIRHMSTLLYKKSLEAAGKTLFLDKTPRYYHIIPELYQIFPQAKYIFLLRNPLAVLCSLVHSWVHQDWLRLSNYKHDIFEAPYLLIRGLEELKDLCLVVRYENFLEYPKQELDKICSYLNINSQPDMLKYDQMNLQDWRFGDRTKVYLNSEPDRTNIDRWMLDLEDPQIWRLVSDYIDYLGPKTLGKLGYSYKEIKHCIARYKPNFLNSWNTVSLYTLSKKPKEFSSLNYEFNIIKLKLSLKNRGGYGTLNRLLDILLS